MADAEKQRPTTYEKSLMRAFGLQSVEELDELLARPTSEWAAAHSESPDEEYDFADRTYEEEDRQRDVQNSSPANVQARLTRGVPSSENEPTGYPLVAGVLAFLVSLVVLLILAGPVTCSDGWHSPSIGRQGACSWHGGVDYGPQILAFLVSVLVGILALVVSAFVGEFAHKLASKKIQRQFSEHRREIKGTVAHNRVACPLCGYPMTLRVARKGPRKGKNFLGCSRFPACRGTRDTGPVVA